MSEEITATATTPVPPQKKCFYYSAFTEEEKTFFNESASAGGLNDEIDLMRVKIKATAVHDPDNLPLIMRAVNTIGRLVRIRFQVYKNANIEEIQRSLIESLEGIEIPPGYIQKHLAMG
jgi:hypothetical protein